ncbi:MAG TPA: Abi-alpha family protein [Nevskiaceae bacterium]|nr:Abi-alpha family protein [Nevskiaceae bacterium]
MSDESVPAIDEAAGDSAPADEARHARARSASLVGSSLAGRLLKRIPGGRFAEERLEDLELHVMGRLKRRLDAIGQGPSMSLLAVSVSGEEAGDPGGMPGNLLRRLLERSQEPRSKRQAEVEYFTILLRQLVPDEARILSALSDGLSYPVIDVLAASKFSMISRPIVESVSSVGKSAGVQAPELTPNYVRHLRRLGLAEIIPGETPDHQQYQILETDSEVRTAVAAASQSGYRTHVVRRSLRMSAVGNRLWAACRISGE